MEKWFNLIFLFIVNFLLLTSFKLMRLSTSVPDVEQSNIQIINKVSGLLRDPSWKWNSFNCQTIDHVIYRKFSWKWQKISAIPGLPILKFSEKSQDNLMTSLSFSCSIILPFLAHFKFLIRNSRTISGLLDSWHDI